MSYTDRGRQKIDLADEGGARVATLLKKTDQLGVLAVDSVPKWVYSLQRLRNVDDAVDSITSIRAGGGGIYVYSGLREAYQALAQDVFISPVICTRFRKSLHRSLRSCSGITSMKNPSHRGWRKQNRC